MQALAIDKTTGGFVVVAGRPTFVKDLEAKAQQVRIRLKTIQGEYFLDPNLGIPYFQDILVKNPNLHFVEFIFSDELRNLGLTNIQIHGSFEKDLRRFTLAWQAVDPEFGPVSGAI